MDWSQELYDSFIWLLKPFIDNVTLSSHRLYLGKNHAMGSPVLAFGGRLFPPQTQSLTTVLFYDYCVFQFTFSAYRYFGIKLVQRVVQIITRHE